MTFLSVIVPTYNSDKTLSKTLVSLLNQQFKDFEILIIDGKSTDKTLEIARSFTNPRIRIFSESDSGIYDAMNKGIKLAGGDWLYFLGSDDAVYDDYVFGTVFETIGNNSYDVVYGNVKVVSDTAWAKNGAIYDGRFDLSKLLRKNIAHQGIFYRKEFISLMEPYNLKYALCADWDMNLRCWSKTEFLYIDIIVAYFYGGGATTKNKTDVNFSSDFVSNIIRYFNINPFHPLINSKSFPRFKQVARLQKESNLLRFYIERLRRKLL